MASTETDIQRTIMIDCSSSKVKLFRNNVGLMYTKNGTPTRVGLCTGSSDIIGITSVTITPDMVGQTVGVFTAVEVKRKKMKASENQIRFIDMIKKLGGYAGVAWSVDTAEVIINGEG